MTTEYAQYVREHDAAEQTLLQEQKKQGGAKKTQLPVRSRNATGAGGLMKGCLSPRAQNARWMDGKLTLVWAAVNTSESVDSSRPGDLNWWMQRAAAGRVTTARPGKASVRAITCRRELTRRQHARGRHRPACFSCWHDHPVPDRGAPQHFEPAVLRITQRPGSAAPQTA